MGHQRLGTLPTTKIWDAVVALITGGADAATVASAVSSAAEGSLAKAAKDPALRRGFWLLTQIPLAARTPDFGAALQALRLEVGAKPTLIEIGAAVMTSLDDVIARDRRSTDFSDMAAATTVESLVSIASRQDDTLFGTTYQADEVHVALRGLASPARFAVLARDFFARLTCEYLGYYLSRVLPDHVGCAGRFQSIQDHHAFEQALILHCREASMIVEEFAAGWYNKRSAERSITSNNAAAFAHVAFGKVRGELRLRAGAAAHA
jgi:hypothetical protein